MDIHTATLTAVSDYSGMYTTCISCVRLWLSRQAYSRCVSAEPVQPLAHQPSVSVHAHTCGRAKSSQPHTVPGAAEWLHNLRKEY